MDSTVINHPVLAIDYGEARFGIAATDDLGLFAHPVETIHVAQQPPLERIQELCEQRRVKTMVIGLPLRLSGEEGDAAEAARALGAQLSELLPDIPIHFCDERYSTVTASEKLRAAGKSARRQKNIIDQAAAVEILNQWLGF